MILKNSNSDTCFSDAPIDGWTEITQEELDAIRESRRVLPDPQIEVDAKLSRLRQVRDGILNRLAGIAFAAQLSGDTATTTAYLAVRQALLGITDGLKELAPELVEPTVVQRYALLREACTPSMVSAFAQVDA